MTEDELKEWDEICAFVWADDPDVEIVYEAHDKNAPHGVNTSEEMLHVNSVAT